MATKRKKASKPTAAQRQLKAEWDKLMAQHAKPLERGAQAKGLEAKAKVRRPKLGAAPSTVVIDKSRDLRQHPSRDTGLGTANLKEVHQYTGTEMLGLGTMHKSNTVPIFRAEDAEAIAKMRR